jgi:hypothetical protein
MLRAAPSILTASLPFAEQWQADTWANKSLLGTAIVEGHGRRVPLGSGW